MRRCFTVLLLVTVSSALLAAAPEDAPEVAAEPPISAPDAPESAALATLFPASTPLFLESDDGASLLRGALDAGVGEHLIASEGWQSFIRSPEGKKFRQGLFFLTAATGRTPLQIIEAALAGDAALGLVAGAGSPQPLVVLRPEDPEFMRNLIQTAVNFSGDEAKTVEVRGVQATVLGNAIFFWEGPTLVVGTERALLEATLGRMRGETADGDLAHAPRYQEMAPRAAALGPVRLFLDLAAIRAARGGSLPALSQPIPNPLGSIVFGGYQQLLRATDTVTLGAEVRDGALRLRGSALPAPEEEIHACYRPAGLRTVIATPESTIAHFQLGRDLAGWWESRLTLVDQSAHAAMAKFSTDIGNVLGGKDFGEEILALTEDTVQLFFLPPAPATEARPHPDPLLPGIALAVPLAQGESQPADLQLLFQTLVTFINIDRSQKDLAPWIFGGETYRGTSITFAAPSAPAGEGTPGIEENFRPAVAVKDGFFLLGTQPHALRQLIDAGTVTPPPGDLPNGGLEVGMTSLHSILAANRAALVTNSVLEGKSVDEAEGEIAAVLSIVKLFDRFAVTVGPSPEGALSVDLVLEFAGAAADQSPGAAEKPKTRERF